MTNGGHPHGQQHPKKDENKPKITAKTVKTKKWIPTDLAKKKQ